jgi:phosphate transport system protein
MTKAHINKAFDHELRLVQDRMLLIAGRVEKMIANSIRAFLQNDIALARQTIEYDKRIDRDELLIDRLCIELLARRQPLGKDLRFIVSVIKMVTYFERMGDLAVKICQRVIKLKHAQANSNVADIEEMAKGVQAMIKDTLEAFLLSDYKKALMVIRQDDLIDEIFRRTTKYFIGEMNLTHQEVENYYHLLSIAKWLERMGDHCTNLAELIIFMVKGEDIRHQQLKKNAVILPDLA